VRWKEKNKFMEASLVGSTNGVPEETDKKDKKDK